MKYHWSMGVGVILIGSLIWLVSQNRPWVHGSRNVDAREVVPGGSHVEKTATPPNHAAGESIPTEPTLSAEKQVGHPPVPPALPWGNPAWRAARFEEAYLQIESSQGRFFQKLKTWPPEKLELLKRQLANNAVSLMQVATQATYPNAVSTASTPAEAMQQAEARNQEALRAVLGDTDYAAYEESRRMETYRNSFDSIANIMRARNIEIDAGSQESILTAYANAIHEISQTTKPGDISQLDAGQISALKKTQMEEFHRALFNKMSAVLDGKQLAAFMEAQLEQDGGS